MRAIKFILSKAIFKKEVVLVKAGINKAAFVKGKNAPPSPKH